MSESGKPTLYLHIGCAKSGSTFLQRAIFPLLDHTQLSVHPRLPGVNGKRGRIAVHAFPLAPEVWDEDERLAENLFLAQREGRDLLISDESLAKPSGLHVGAHLGRILDQARTRGFGRVKLLLVVRRQDERIGANYAQRSNLLLGANQDRFEDFVAARCDPARERFGEGAVFDYAAMVEALFARLPREDVRVLPLEQLSGDREGFLTAVAAHFDAPEAAMRDILAADSRRQDNKRSAASGRWTLRSYDPDVALMQLGRARPTILERLRNKRERGREISLSAEMAAKIRAAYAASNRKLEALTGLDLGKYGYF